MAMIGLIGFGITDIVRVTIITGTDSGSSLINNVFMLVFAAALVIGILMAIAGAVTGGKRKAGY